MRRGAGLERAEVVTQPRAKRSASSPHAPTPILRHQLPAYSPITARAIWAAMLHGLGVARDRPGRLATLLARHYRAEHVRLFGSGTQALQAALRLAMRQVGDSRVALPAFTCFDVAAAAVAVRARIRLYDLDPSSLAPDPDSLSRVVDDGARVVVIAPLFGLPVEWEAVTGVVEARGGVALEDAAQSHGAEWHGRPLGSLGRISVLSFGRGKGWTGGTGGALLLRAGQSPDGIGGAERGPALRDELQVLGRLAAQWALARPAVYALPAAVPWLHLGETVYRAALPPRPMSRAACASVQALQAIAEQEAGARKRNAAAFLHELAATPHVRPVRPHPAATAGFLRFPLRLARGLAGFPEPRRATRLGLTLAYPSTLAALAPVQALLDDRESHWPGAEELARTLFTLPTHSRLRAAERNELIRLLLSYRA